jgi:prepilin-type N-terminal cleavage/methylation domain-containing protein
MTFAVKPGMRTAKKQSGFTIIEVMLVTMIIGVLAAMVLPNIRVEMARVKMSEALLAFGTCRNMVTELYNSGGDSPGAGNWGCESVVGTPVSIYVDSVSTEEDGLIKVSLRGFNDLRIDTMDLTLAPLDNTGSRAVAGSIVRRWRCGSIADGTSVSLTKYLPGSCRG